MSSGDFETCKFGHHIENYHGDIEHNTQNGIQKGKIKDIDDLEGGLNDIIGEPYKQVKVKANSQGMPRAAAVDAADKFDDDLDYEVHKVQERIFVSPQSNLHGEYMQRRQQAEQNIQNTMQNLGRLKKEKDMIEHDIRKLRTRAEDMRTGNETQVKGDFIELVDGAGAAGGQGGDEASLKFYRDNNIYPSIVADFNEMSSLEDLEEDGPLADIPNNEKAILRKKYSMFEKWKDMYGSEIQRKLDTLKSELRRVERAIEQTEEWLQPYVRDMIMINEGSLEEHMGDITKYMHLKGTSTLTRHMQFICSRGMKNKHGEVLEMVDDRSEATHYRVIVLNIFHLNLANWSQPNSPDGTSVAKMMWHPLIVCKHVFENFFQEKIDRQQNQLENLMDEYTGGFDDSEGRKIRKARTDQNLQIREIREQIAEKIDGDVPIEFSSTLRRIEDGIDKPEVIEEKYENGEDMLDALEEILEEELKDDDPDEKKMYTGLTKKRKKFVGQVDASVLPPTSDPMDDLKSEFKFDYYYDWKLGLNLYTMK